MSAKRRRTGNKFGEPVIGKDGTFECPVCYKTFAEESRYFGHVGAHASILDKASSGRATNDSLAEISFSLQELTESAGQNNKVSGGEAGFLRHSCSNEHGDNSSTVTEFFSTKYKFLEPWSRPEEIPPIPSVGRYTNYKGHTDAAMLERASNSNNQSASNMNGFAGVAAFNNQPGSSHVVGPTAFGTTNHYQNQIIDHGMTAPKHVNSNTVKARDVNLNSCLDTISFPIASANNETSAALNEANQSSFSAKCFSGSFNNNDGVSSCSGPTNKISSSLGTANKTSAVAFRCLDTSHGPYSDDYGAIRANPFASKNNIAAYQSDLGMRLVYPVATKADCFGSGSVQRRKSDKELTSNTKERNQRNDNVESRASKEAGLHSEAYNSVVVSQKRVLHNAQFNNSFTHTKPNASSRCSLPESNTPTTGNFIKGSGSDNNCVNRSLINRGDASFTTGSFINRPINNNEQNVPMLEVMGKSNNEMQNHYNVHTPGCEPRAASSASRSANGRVSMPANFGSMSAAAESVCNVPMTNTSQDLCDLQLGFGAQKQQIFSSHADLRTATAGSPQLGSVARKNSLPTGSSQFGSMDRPKSFPTETPQFGGYARPNLSSQFGGMTRSSAVPPESSQFIGSMVRSNSVTPAESSQFGSMARPNSVPPAIASQFGNPSQNFVSATEPTLVLGYAPQMGGGPPPPVHLGWDLSLPRMVTGGSMVTCVCIWCNSQFHLAVYGFGRRGWICYPLSKKNSQFHHFGPVDGHQAGSFGFICPACKDRMSGHHNMPNNVREIFAAAAAAAIRKATSSTPLLLQPAISPSRIWSCYFPPVEKKRTWSLLPEEESEIFVEWTVCRFRLRVQQETCSELPSSASSTNLCSKGKPGATKQRDDYNSTAAASLNCHSCRARKSSHKSINPETHGGPHLQPAHQETYPQLAQTTTWENPIGYEQSAHLPHFK
ncbi:hypothetical protein U9M48_033919, partial [Paspalum notatum var. saurae]